MSDRKGLNMADTEVAELTGKRLTQEEIDWIVAFEDRRGRLDPMSLVTAAAEEDCPVHGRFEWDDAVAGTAYRLEQARHLIRRIKFEVVYQEVTERVVRYVREPDAAEPMYLAVPKVRAVDQVEKIMAEELGRLLGNANRTVGIARAKAGELAGAIVSELIGIRDSIAALREKLIGG